MKLKLRNPGVGQWAVFLLLGLLLAVAALPVAHKENKLPVTDTEQEAESSVLEKKMETLLSGVEGVGKTKVIVMTDEEKNGGAFYHSGPPKVTGVLIAAEGADYPVTVREIQEAVQALFQIEAHKIKVMKLK